MPKPLRSSEALRDAGSGSDFGAGEDCRRGMLAGIKCRMEDRSNGQPCRLRRPAAGDEVVAN